MDFIIRWIVDYFWDNAVNTVIVTILVTIIVIVFSFLNDAGCMVSNIEAIEDNAQEGFNCAFIVIDIILAMISIFHSATAIIQASKGRGRRN